MATQLDLFDNERMIHLLKEIKELKDTTENVRRGLFARYNQIERDVMDLRAKVDEKKEG